MAQALAMKERKTVVLTAWKLARTRLARERMELSFCPMLWAGEKRGRDTDFVSTDRDGRIYLNLYKIELPFIISDVWRKIRPFQLYVPRSGSLQGLEVLV